MVIEESEFLLYMMLMILSAGICAVLFTKLKLPPIIGYLLAGILLTNGLIKWVTENIGGFNMGNYELIVSILKDFGLVMLMFCIGTELSFDKLKKHGKFAVLVAVIQLPLMVLSGVIFGSLILGLDGTAAITLGAVISGSSTAVVAAVLKSQERLSKEKLDILILVTVMEDIGQVIILSMVTPLFKGSSMEVLDLIVLIVTIIVFMLAALLLGVKFLPRILNWVGDKTNKEVLLVMAIGLCFLMAYLSVLSGMSMAIGAFLMGVIVSQCKYSEEIQHNVEPMKELFMAIFFISVGMEIEINTFISGLGVAVIIFFIFIVSKFLTVYLGYFVGGENFENSFVSALSLMAMGEFAFIIAAEAKKYSVITADLYSSIIGAALISMIVLPLVAKKMYVVVDKVENDCPPLLARWGGAVYAARNDISKKMDSSPTVQQFVKKNLKKTYFSFILIVVIEIVFISLSNQIIDFLAELLRRFITDLTVTDSQNIAYIIVVLANLFILMPPTMTLVRAAKRLLDSILNKDGEWQPKNPEAYERFMAVGNFVIVFIIDLLLIILLPGPMSWQKTVVIIPIAVILILLALVLSKRKVAKIKAEENIVETTIDEKIDEEYNKQLEESNEQRKEN